VILRGRQADEDGLEVDLSPLIDVIFLLLIFFVLTTSFSQEKQLQIERPSASTGSDVDSEPLRVALDSKGVAFVNGSEVAPWLLQARVEAILRGRPGTEVLLIADERVPSGRMVEVIDQCRLAGASNVAIATRRGSP
jgi:biopolymer transport protein ExbD